MSTDDTHDDSSTDAERGERSVRERIEQSAATGELDEGIIDLLTWVLDTDTRARIYLYLRKQPSSTSDEIATGTGLYPSTVREALAALHDEGNVLRQKRELNGAGNNPYEYESISPRELVLDVVEQVQETLNMVFTLDERLEDRECDDTPVSITVDENVRANDD
ncbi:winged helix-turn-helix domain-containing protein [Halocatena marina]|uniref:Helix-turn-helix domain-containing protein n=1 Tax=Halocatena marina TaxID=2934937 RepID=A0ABD5YMP0_9EURY|nr:winged helix-turn-helix domain-containing protein [Halocatena marina]